MLESDLLVLSNAKMNRAHKSSVSILNTALCAFIFVVMGKGTTMPTTGKMCVGKVRTMVRGRKTGKTGLQFVSQIRGYGGLSYS
ncbi:hypothetical protein D3C71_1094370 [compost metagenome]